MFNVTILSSKRVLYEGQAQSVFLSGDLGEFEVMENHKSIISLLKEGDIVVDGEKSIFIKRGIAKMNKNEFVAMVEE